MFEFYVTSDWQILEKGPPLTIHILIGSGGLLASLMSWKSAWTSRTSSKSFPVSSKDLDETYSRILAGIYEDDRPDAIRILHLVFSERPLTIEEAVDGIAVESTDVPL